MHVDVFPEFAPPRVLIQTACVGLSTSDVEQLVTVPLEAAMNGIQGLDDLRSKSVPQLSSIEVLFKPGTDLLRARQLVQERLATVSPSLPTWAAPPVMLAPVSATGPRHADRHDLEEPFADRDVDDGLLDDPRPAAAGARRRQRGDLERAAPAHGGAGGAVQDAGARGSRWTR